MYFNLDYLHHFLIRKYLGWNISQVITIRFSKTAVKRKMKHLFLFCFSSQHSFCSRDEWKWDYHSYINNILESEAIIYYELFMENSTQWAAFPVASISQQQINIGILSLVCLNVCKISKVNQGKWLAEFFCISKYCI